jgi:translation initiation factor 2B subunit (eIF-2B alpha/beta/delta family)
MRRLMPWVVGLVFFLVIGGAAIWGRQQDSARRVAEARAEALEAEVAGLQVTVTAIVRAQAATATAVAVAANQPEVSLRNALDLVLQAYKEPSDARLNALQAAFDPPALSIERPEAEHLISGGTHLGGQSAYQILSMQMTEQDDDRVQIQTREQWLYDEVDAQNRRSRCVREETEQTYTMRRAPAGWVVADVSLSGAGRRSDC